MNRRSYLARNRRLDRCSVELAITLGQVCVTHREKAPRDSHRVIQSRPFADATIVQIAACQTLKSQCAPTCRE